MGIEAFLLSLPLSKQQAVCYVCRGNSLHNRCGITRYPRNARHRFNGFPQMILSTESGFAQELTKRSLCVEKSSTDELIEKVETILKEGIELDEAILEDMVVHLGDTRGMSRLQLVELFGEIGVRAVEVLVCGLKGCGNPVVRRSCGKALAKIRDPGAVPPLVEAMVGDQDTVTRASAAGALARVGDGAVSALIAVVRDVSVDMVAKGHAAWALAFMGGDIGERLFELAHDRNEDVRIAIVGAVGAIAIGDALPAMGAAGEIEGDDWIEGEEGQRKMELRERAIGVLRDRLKDESLAVRAEAATALANAGDSESVKNIENLLDDENAEVRRAAALALMKMSNASVIDSLNKRANDENEADTVRGVARLAAATLSRSAERDAGW